MNHPKAKILVVDDDLNLLELLVDTLETIGYDVAGAPGGLEALEKLRAGQFDLMISDIKMPGMDGIALLKEARRQFPKLPVLFITGVVTPEIIGRASADGFLAKPFRINHIEEMIENTLRNKPELVAGQVQRVLVVDDDETFREMLTDALRYNEYNPSAVSSAEEALERLKQGEIDAVVADIKMPGMDGIALSKAIREKYPSLPVVLITAYLSDEDIERVSADHVADGVLRKPFRVESIIELLNQLSPAAVGNGD